MASLLPMSKTIGLKFEKLIRRLIWSSSEHLLKVALDELKLPLSRGGLGLPCIHRMGDSLLLTQSLRLLKNSDFKSKFFMLYWIGQILVDVIPDMDPEDIEASAPSYFEYLAVLLSDAKIADLFTSANWKGLTNKAVYQYQISLLNSPKVELVSGSSMSLAWRRYCQPSLCAEIREILFLLLHRKLPVKERLFSIKIVDDPFCDQCCETDEPSDLICDLEHFFCQCNNVIEVWGEIRGVIRNLLQSFSSDVDLTTLSFPNSIFDEEITWLLGSYFHYVWNNVHVRRAAICRA